jgi:hypothetical protein
MWVIYWTVKKKDVSGYSRLESDYYVTENEDGAKALYESRLKNEKTLTAGYAKVVASTPLT